MKHKIFEEYENKLLEKARNSDESKRTRAVSALSKVVDKRNAIIKRNHPDLDDFRSEDEKLFYRCDPQDILDLGLQMGIPKNALDNLIKLKGNKK